MTSLEKYGEKLITLQVNNDEGVAEFEKKLPWKDLYHCKLIYNMVNDLGALEMETDEEFVIPLPNTNVKGAQYLDYISQYAQFMRTADYPKDERKEDTKIESELTAWEKTFAESMSKADLINTILLANYFEFNYMLEALCCATAGLMKDKSTEQMRQEWGIKNDFTKEEEEKIKKENQFIEEAQERV